MANRNQYLFCNVTSTYGGQTRGIHRYNLISSSEDILTGKQPYDPNFAILDDDRVVVAYYTTSGTCTNETIDDSGCLRFSILNFSTMAESIIVDLNLYEDEGGGNFEYLYYWRFAVIDNYLIISNYGEDTLGDVGLRRRYNFYVYSIVTNELVFEDIGILSDSGYYIDYPEQAPVVVENKAFFVYQLANAFEESDDCLSCNDNSRIYEVNVETSLVSLIQVLSPRSRWVKIYQTVYNPGDEKLYFVTEEYDTDTSIGYYCVAKMGIDTHVVEFVYEINSDVGNADEFPMLLIPSHDDVYMVKRTGLIYSSTDDFISHVASIGTINTGNDIERQVPLGLSNAIDSNNYIWKMYSTFVMGYSVAGGITQSVDGIPTPGGTSPKQYIHVADGKIFVFNDSSTTAIKDDIYELT
jgi:hypothetical protein